MHNKEITECFKILETSIDGLSSSEALKRLKNDGENILKEPKKASIISKIIHTMGEPLILILIIASIISAIFDDESIIETVVISVVIMINITFEVYESFKADKALNEIKKLTEQYAKVKRDEKILSIPTKDLVKGDLILLEKGDFIPADSRLIEANNLSTDESTLTGESINVFKQIQKIDENLPLGELSNMVFSSTYVTTGNGTALICNTGMNTVIGGIANVLLKDENEKTPLEIKLKQISKTISIMCILACLIIFIIELYANLSITQSFKIAISLAVAAIPEGLSTVVAVVLSIGIAKMSKKKAIIKKLTSVETLGCCDIICSDKTGTLTYNMLNVEKIFVDRKITDFNKLNSHEKKMLMFLDMATDTMIVNGELTGDKTDLAIKKIQDKYGEKAEFEVLKITPFDSSKKYMQVIIKWNNKKILIVKGAFEVLKTKCLNKKRMNELELEVGLMADESLRVIAMGYKFITNDETNDYLEFGMILGLLDKERLEAKKAVLEAKKAHIKTIMITGDSLKTACAIAKRLDILKDDNEAISAYDLKKLPDEEFLKIVDNISVYARCEPLDKLRIVETLKRKNHIIAMTGDGVNDSLSLKKADIGCAMGSGCEVAKSVSDVILLDDNFETILEAIKVGRNIYANIQKCVRYLLSSNIGEVLIIFLASLLSIIFKINLGVPLLSLHLLWVNLITDSLPAFSLGLEPCEKKIMEQHPRNKTDSFFSNNLMKKIIFEGLLIGCLTLVSFLIGYIIDPLNLSLRQTMAFVTLSMQQLIHAYNVKSEDSIFSNTTLNNKSLNLSFIIGNFLLFIIIYNPFLAKIFKTTTLSLIPFLISLSCALFILVYGEVKKYYAK